MNITWEELKFFLTELKDLPVSESLELNENEKENKKENFAVSTGCDIESWVFYPERVKNIEIVEKTVNFFKSQKVSFMWPVYDGGEKILEEGGLLYAGSLTGMIYENYSFEKSFFQTANYDEWARTAWHGFGGGYDDVPENYFALVKAFSENPKFSLYTYKINNKNAGSFMLVDEPDGAGVYYFATIPEERRKGIARLMMKEICNLSRGKKILLQATPMGLPFYKNFGFKELCKIPVYSDSSDVF